MNIREAVEAVYEAAPHIPPRGTVEYHTRQLRDLLEHINRGITRVVGSLPTKEARAAVARKRAHEVYELEVREAAARRDASLARADAAVEEARAELGPLEARKAALLKGSTALASLPRLPSGNVDWVGVARAVGACEPAEVVAWLRGEGT